MTRPAEPPAPVLPFPIFQISSKIERHLLYDINVITWLRKTHHILGVLIGTLPQIPQQNVFLGLPLELMPEEARLLAEKGLAYIVEDLEWHENGMKLTTHNEREAFRRDLAREGREAARAAERKQMESTERAMRKLRLGSTPDREAKGSSERNDQTTPDPEESESLFSAVVSQQPGSPSVSDSRASIHNMEAWNITPTTSYPPLPTPQNNPGTPLPTVNPSSYALFKHLHAHDYFMSPGLRFGCQFLVYPGDPLRFHSHFLAVSMDWDEEINLLDMVGGGRLGTGVKKGWLIGGVEKDVNVEHTTDAEEATDAPVRTFCIEWGGM
ncbi:tRNA-splicing endonuclease subunit [Trapelia coarctata]|nr:tRNA-splicing endonuclease subunit [Trapelia coarctata]